MPDSKPVASQPSLLPLPPRALLRRLDAPVVASPYIVPDSSKEPGTEAEVVAIPTSPFRTEWGVDLPCPVAVGQRVMVGKYSGVQKFRGEDVLLVRWDEILAIIPDPGAEVKETATYADIIKVTMDYHAVHPISLPSSNLPSSADLDAVADEHRAEELTNHFLNKVRDDTTDYTTPLSVLPTSKGN